MSLRARTLMMAVTYWWMSVFGEGDAFAEQVELAVGADVADDFDAALGGQPGRRLGSRWAGSGSAGRSRSGSGWRRRGRCSGGGCCGTRRRPRSRLRRWSMLLNTSVRKNDLSHTSLKCSMTPLRHGSRSGMNRAVTRGRGRSATIGPKYCQAGGIPPRKLAWLSNWATAGHPDPSPDPAQGRRRARRGGSR